MSIKIHFLSWKPLWLWPERSGQQTRTSKHTNVDKCPTQCLPVLASIQLVPASESSPHLSVRKSSAKTAKIPGLPAAAAAWITELKPQKSQTLQHSQRVSKRPKRGANWCKHIQLHCMQLLKGKQNCVRHDAAFQHSLLKVHECTTQLWHKIGRCAYRGPGKQSPEVPVLRQWGEPSSISDMFFHVYPMGGSEGPNRIIWMEVQEPCFHMQQVGETTSAQPGFPHSSQRPTPHKISSTSAALHT